MKSKFYCYSLFFLFVVEMLWIPSANALSRIMPLGDSITQGNSSGEPQENRQVSYRKALWDKLIAAEYEIDFVGSMNSGSDIMGVDAADHEGHPGWHADTAGDQDILGQVYTWLWTAHPVNVILLHIGTNDISAGGEDAMEISAILDEIDRYENDFGIDVWVILAKIINVNGHDCASGSTTTTFNDDVFNMAWNRMNSGDKIKIVDMECATNIIYSLQPAGDMFNSLHPYQNPANPSIAPGYIKMANGWYDALTDVLPSPIPPPAPDSGGGGGCFIDTAGKIRF